MMYLMRWVTNISAVSYEHIRQNKRRFTTGSQDVFITPYFSTANSTGENLKIQDSKAFIRQCTDINHIKQRNNVKKRIKIFLDEYMSGDPR